MQLFQEAGLSEDILKAIGEMGFVEPTPIQGKIIPEILNNENDLVALAQTGTGKTGAFGLPVIQMIEADNRDVQVLVMCPTRELCLQIAKDLNAFAKYIEQINIVPVYGGSDIKTQIRALRRGPQIVIGTPGRLIDLIDRGVLKLNNLRRLILDEADEMLNMGFKDDLEKIISQTPEGRQMLLFSATMPKTIASISKRYMNNPIEIKVGTKNAGADNVEHHYYMVHASDRYNALKRIVDMNPLVYGIVFCRTRQETKDVADKLLADGYNADSLHGDLSQAQRDLVMHRFRGGHLQLLVATDVAARGIDVNNLTHVINYNLPDDFEVYIHRSGRTGRAGKSGICISIIHTRETRRIAELERVAKKTFIRKMVPTGDEITERQLLHFVEKVENIEYDEETINKYMPAISEKFAAMDRDELIKRFVAMAFSRFVEYYKDAPDINVTKSNSRERSSSRGGHSRGDYARLFINAGKTDKINTGDIIGMINKKLRGVEVKVGKIEILGNFSFFEVDKEYETDVVKALNKMSFSGRRLVVEPASPKTGGGRRGSGGRQKRRRFN
ncbi:DEAD/DEAH box helicase [Marinilabiliaceae bacterium JC017]|nr:DEAD/DEAH box helicase [Marinilabiliaceae bacterium JC017]